jgi:probable F420-dependent oxidoreductase
MPLTFGVTTLPPGNVWTAKEVARWAARAEALGFDAVETGDHVAFHEARPDPFSVLAAAASGTQRVRVETAVLIAPLRHPVYVAHLAASLDVLSGGRFTLGVGVGGEGAAEFAALGVPLRERGRRTDETIEICRALWTSDDVRYGGRIFSLDGVTLPVKPVQPGGPPVWVGGRSDAAIRRAARLGDGWLAVWASPRRIAEASADLEGKTIGLHVWGAFAHGREEAAARLAPVMEATYRLPFERFERYAFLGPEQAWVERVAEYAAAGVTRFNGLLSGERPEEQMERWAGVAEVARAVIRSSADM